MEKYLKKAENSKLYRWLLNRILHRMIPFNKPHGFWIDQISQEKISVRIPFKKINLNHIRGIHACAIATACEYASGFLLLRQIGTKDYRIIMQKLSVEYFYQAKTDVLVDFELKKERIEKEVLQELGKSEHTFITLVAKPKNKDGILLAECTTVWQVKPWSKVKTKLS